MLNALTDIAWIDTVDGPMTPRDVLVRAHELSGGVAGFDPLLSGVRVGAQFRFLMGLTALVIRESGADVKAVHCFDAVDVDRVLAGLSPVSDPFDLSRPFLQGWLTAAEREFEVAFKSPALLELGVESDNARAFWSTSRSTWPVADALRSLLEFSTYFATSNNVVHGRSTWNCSPGRGFVPGNLPSTELIWAKDTLFDALLLNTPKMWVAGAGLPFWADRTGVHAREQVTGDSAGGVSPIWVAGWTGNIAVANWSEDRTELLGVAVGGAGNYHAFLGMRLPKYVPPARKPKTGKPETTPALEPALPAPKVKSEATVAQKLSRKEAIAIRDLNDPLRIHEDRLIKERLVRLPFRLAPAESTARVMVSWKSKSLSPAMVDRAERALRQPTRDGSKIVFLAHEYSGTPSSPQLRFSQHRQTAAIDWIDADDRAEEVADLAKRVDQMSYWLERLFARDGALSDLAPLRGQFLATFWEEVTAPFTRFITTSNEFVLPEHAHADIRHAVATTFRRMGELTPITNGGIHLLAAGRTADVKAREMFPPARPGIPNRDQA